MNAADDLYRELILDHNRSPRNFRVPAEATHRARGLNPFCGDEYDVGLIVDAGGAIREAGFCGQGCAISKASASLMTEALRGQSATRAEELFVAFQALVTGRYDADRDPARLGALTAFRSVWQYPSRVKCASLCWHAAHSALARGENVSTE